jgi:hypothetical protein
MRSGLHRAISWVSIYTLTVAGLAMPGSALAECPLEPIDQTTTQTAGSLANCGSPTWEFKATVPGNDQDDEGPYTGQGVCLGGYTNCNCGTAPETFLNSESSQFFHFDYRNNDDGSYT